MSEDTLEDLFKAGGAFALAIAFLFFWSGIQNTGSPSESVNLVERNVVMMLLAVVPANELALSVDAVVALIGGSIAASQVDFDIRAFVITAGFLWIGTNLLINWFFPPF
jgi:hypothetical protein